MKPHCPDCGAGPDKHWPEHCPARKPVIGYDAISPSMRRFLGAYEGYRRVGFGPDGIYCQIAMCGRSGVLSCFALLKAQGTEFRFACGPVDDEARFGKEYVRVAHALVHGGIPQEDLDRIWQESELYATPGVFLAALVAKGIVPPDIAAN
jgi:hypothetical protein